jgi:protein-tyrosine phosphatase
MDRARVLFVCMGNICRSPTAEGVFRTQVSQAGLADRIVADSAGTLDYHEGKPPDKRAVAAAAARGYDLAPLRARQVAREDFRRYGWILAMDRTTLGELKQLAPADFRGRLGLFLDFAPSLGVREVPDPYYGAHDGFERVLDLVEAGSRALLTHITAHLARAK